MRKFDYIYADPTGNITILVKENVPVEERPGVSDYLCSLEPTCEQVGFVYYDDNDADIKLRMAGGEFCGNATMSTAALFARESGIECGETKNVKVRTSGTKEIVNVTITLKDKEVYAGCVTMPVPKSYGIETLSYDDTEYKIPIVKFEGMYHLIYETELSKSDAEKAIVKWAKDLNAPALGIMMLQEETSTLTPLVYVTSLNSFYWEHSCASGTTATGYYLSKKYQKPIDISFNEPGGILNLRVNEDGKLFLSGNVTFR